MTIGIIVAMSKELQLLLPLLTSPRETVIDDTTFHLGDINGHSVVIMKSGIGKVNAALAASDLIKKFAPELVINTGVAGGTGSHAGILDVVIGDRIAYHDVWCGPGTEEGQAARCPRFFHSAESVVELDCINGRPNIYHGLIASGDIFVSRKSEIDRIRAMYPDVLAVDMESAAIAQTCYLLDTPFFCLRVISDTPGDADNIAQYDNFWDDAPRQTFSVLSDIIDAIEPSAEDAGGE